MTFFVALKKCITNRLLGRYFDRVFTFEISVILKYLWETQMNKRIWMYDKLTVLNNS